ncbi:MAG: hypothetical protein JSS64_04000 [Bacteroidetes bacterium]|nr:hypothetical protein [Bacteroidota bacterium]
MQFFQFLKEASEDKNLAIFRQEAEPDDDEDENANDGDARKPPKRMFSESLKEMIAKYDPDFACEENRSDLYCLKNYIEANISLFDYKNTENFKKQLKQLVSIVTSLTLNSTSYMRGTFVFITGFFRDYWLPKGEAKSKPVLDIVGEIVHAPESLVKMYLDQKNRRLQEKHRDKFEINFLELDDTVRKLVAFGSSGNTKKHGAAWALAIEICTGARKIEIIDPTIRFMTFEDYEAKKEFDIIKFGDPDAEFIKVKRDHIEGNLLSHTIVQIGVAKDKAQAHNKHYEKAGQTHKLVASRPLIKPTVFYDAEFIVNLIHTFRKNFGLTIDNFKGRVAAGAQWSSRLFHPLMEEYFPRPFAKAKRHGWGLGSHFGRKLYAASSFKVFSRSVQRAAGEIIGLQTWISIVLGHMGGLQTQISYDVIQWVDYIDPEHLKMPNDELVRELQREVLFYRKEIEDNRKLMSVVLEKLAIYERDKRKESKSQSEEEEDEQEIPKSAYASFKTKDGSFITIARAPPIKNRTDEQKKEMLDGLAAELESHSLKVNTTTLRKLGIGAELSGEYISKRNNNAPRAMPEQKQEQANGQSSVSPPQAQSERVTRKKPEKKTEAPKESREKNKKGHNKDYYELQPGEKIISGDPKSSDAANKVRHERDVETLGAENVLEQEHDCTGTVSDLVEIGYKKKRKICKD